MIPVAHAETVSMIFVLSRREFWYFGVGRCSLHGPVEAVRKTTWGAHKLNLMHVYILCYLPIRYDRDRSGSFLEESWTESMAVVSPGLQSIRVPREFGGDSSRPKSAQRTDGHTFIIRRPLSERDLPLRVQSPRPRT